LDWLPKVQGILGHAHAKDIEVVVLNDPEKLGKHERQWGWDESVQWADCTNNQMEPVTVLNVEYLRC